MLIIVFCLGFSHPRPAQAAPPFWGTIFLDPDIITETDPSTYLKTEDTGLGMREMYDRREGWVDRNAFLFEASFSDAPKVEIQVNPEFESVDAARAEALKFAPVIGRLPKCLREELETVWIHKGNNPFGGGNNNLLIHVGQAEEYLASGILEETLVHEASHTSLDGDHAHATKWLAAEAADDEFISTYAEDNPYREDVAESFLLYYALKHRPDRISESLANTISETIPNRIAYFDEQDFDFGMKPVGNGDSVMQEPPAEASVEVEPIENETDPIAKIVEEDLEETDALFDDFDLESFVMMDLGDEEDFVAGIDPIATIPEEEGFVEEDASFVEVEDDFDLRTFLLGDEDESGDFILMDDNGTFAGEEFEEADIELFYETEEADIELFYETEEADIELFYETEEEDIELFYETEEAEIELFYETEEADIELFYETEEEDIELFYETEEDESTEDDWNLATDHGDGWREFDWFGYFFESGQGWIFHYELGWIYRVGGCTDSIWFWKHGLGWAWTNADIYPYLYRPNSCCWIFLNGGTEHRWDFYDFGGERWLSSEERLP